MNKLQQDFGLIFELGNFGPGASPFSLALLHEFGNVLEIAKWVVEQALERDVLSRWGDFEGDLLI